MTIQDLQDELRSQVRARIGRGELTGSGLARAANFPQGHLSNFLNSRRGLSLESMDRLLRALGIGVVDLMDSEAMERRRRHPRSHRAMETIMEVAPEVAMQARIGPEDVLGTRSFSKAFLHKLKPRGIDRRDWTRFVLIKLDVREAGGFFPRSVTTTLLVDRHYTSLHPYRRLQPNLYVMSFEGRTVAAHISVCDNCLVLRPREPRQAVEIIRMERGRRYEEYVVGRVCHVGM